MARLTPEERAALQRQLDDDAALADEFEVELWNDKGEGARVPYSKGKSWLAKAFPGLEVLEPPKDETKADDKAKADDGKVRPAHFGGQRRTAG